MQLANLVVEALDARSRFRKLDRKCIHALTHLLLYLLRRVANRFLESGDGTLPGATLVSARGCG